MFFIESCGCRALIAMYTKLENKLKAYLLFDKVHDADIVSLAIMILRIVFLGYSRDAFKLLDLMERMGAIPNSMTFVCVLLAHGHVGQEDDGCK